MSQMPDPSDVADTSVDADTVGHLVRERAKTHGDATAVKHQDQTVTYDELETRSNRVANGLAELGVEPGDHVAVDLTNRLEYLDIWFGISKLGATMVPLNVALKGPMLEHNLDDSDSSVLIVEESLLDPVLEVHDELSKLQEIVLLGDHDGLADATSYQALLDAADTPSDVPVRGSDPATIIYTSGTTGPPKGVVLPHHSYINTGQWFVKTCRITPEDVPFTTLPLFHVNAQQTTTVGSILAGVPFALETKFSPSSYLDQIRDYGATVFNYIGSIIPLLHKQPERPDDADNPARLGIGAAAPEEIWEDFEERFDVTLIEGYGLTETGTVCTVNPPDAVKKGTIGPAIDYMEVTVVDPDTDQELDPGETGEIVVRPQEPYSMMLEYYKRPGATVEAWRNLWFHTGDLGVRDEDGYLKFVDRMSYAIRRRGENVSSFFVQQAIDEHPAVLESAVYGVPSDFDDNEDEVKADVVLQEDASVDPEALIEWCAERLPYFAVPRYIEFRESFPKTATERTRKFKLREAGVEDAWDREEAGVEVPR